MSTAEDQLEQINHHKQSQSLGENIQFANSQQSLVTLKNVELAMRTSSNEEEFSLFN